MMSPLFHREKNLLIVPSSGGDTSVFQWPPFLLASKVNILCTTEMLYNRVAILFCSLLRYFFI